MFVGGDHHGFICTRYRNAFVCGDAGFVALALAADFTCACVQFDACFLIGLVWFAGLAVGEEADAAFDCVVVVALGCEVDVLAGGDVAGITAAENGVFGCGDSDACRTRELQLRFAVGAHLALATLSALVALLSIAVATCCRFDDFCAVLLLLDGVDFFGFWFVLFFVVLELGVVLLCGAGERYLELVALLYLTLGFS